MNNYKLAMKMPAFELMMWFVSGRQPLPLSYVKSAVENNEGNMFKILSELACQYHTMASPKDMPLITLGISPEGLDGIYRHPFIRQGFHYQMRVTKDGKVLGEIPPDSGKSLRAKNPAHQVFVDTLHEIINYDLSDELFLTLGRLVRGRIIDSYVNDHPEEFPKGVIPAYIDWLKKLLVNGM